MIKTQQILSAVQQNTTPFYWYDMELLNSTLESAANASGKYNYNVHYALKANSNLPILQTIAAQSFGADCVSGNEIKRALEAGFSADNIAFAGVGKTDEEINIGLEHGIFTFNCESIEELLVINALAKQRNTIARIAIRVNPNVNANTHHYITTGLEENKFGINRWEFEEVLATLKTCDHVQLTGLHCHIGSQVTDLGAYRSLCLRINELQTWFIDHNILFDHINVGGGLGIDYYQPDTNPIVDFDSFFGIFDNFLELRPRQTLHFELGRSLVGSIGSLVSKVLYIKKGQHTNFAIIDAGMTELIRPALYQAYHKIENLSQNELPHNEFYDVVGPICESSDCFGKRVKLPVTKRSDIIAIRCTGAYGEVMANNYNLREKANSIYLLTEQPKND